VADCTGWTGCTGRASGTDWTGWGDWTGSALAVTRWRLGPSCDTSRFGRTDPPAAARAGAGADGAGRITGSAGAVGAVQDIEAGRDAAAG
jgi:hypothetical protein